MNPPVMQFKSEILNETIDYTLNAGKKLYYKTYKPVIGDVVLLSEVDSTLRAKVKRELLNDILACEHPKKIKPKKVRIL